MDEAQLYALSPLVSDSIAHNARTLSNIRSLASTLLGIAAGALQLQSFAGFAFYAAGMVLVSGLVWACQISGQGDVGHFFGAVTRDEEAKGTDWIGVREVLLGGVGIECVMGFVMGWTLLFNLVGT